MKTVFQLSAVERLGQIEQYRGLQLIANGPPQVFIGEICEIVGPNNTVIIAEVLGFDTTKVYLMAFENAKIVLGAKVRATGKSLMIPVGTQFLGRIVNALGSPLDNQGKIVTNDHKTCEAVAVNPFNRVPITQVLSTGVAAIDTLLPLGQGQRIGLFAGSGVGKTTLLGTLTQHIPSDITIVVLIGERGREVHDFIENYLDPSTKSKTVTIVACSDDNAIMRRQAIFTANTFAEYFCQQGASVLLCVDSLTRFAMAQRELGLALNETSSARGYTPSVFALLPKVTERAGNFLSGSITAIYTVLVEGDDFNEPIADHVRALLDGHIVLTRLLAQRSHYPAIDVLQSISRLKSQLLTQPQQTIANKVVKIISDYRQNQDLIEVGAYKSGQNSQLDYALEKIQALDAFCQRINPPSNFEDPFEVFKQLEGILL